MPVPVARAQTAYINGVSGVALLNSYPPTAYIAMSLARFTNGGTLISPPSRLNPVTCLRLVLAGDLSKSDKSSNHSSVYKTNNYIV